MRNKVVDTHVKTNRSDDQSNKYEWGIDRCVFNMHVTMSFNSFIQETSRRKNIR